MKDLSYLGTGGWSYKLDGLCVGTIWTFDNSLFDPTKYISGHQDNGINLSASNTSGMIWKHIAGGDGYGAQISHDLNGLALYLSNGNAGGYNINNSAYYSVPLPQDYGEQQSSTFTNTFKTVKGSTQNSRYIGLKELYEQFSNNQGGNITWEQESDLYQHIPLQWQRQVTEIAISPSSPNHIYLATLGIDNAGLKTWDLEPSLFKTISGGLNNNLPGPQSPQFVDLTPNLPKTTIGNLATPVITGIAIDPNNSNRIWVSFSGYDPNIRIWHSNDGGVNWFNYDPSQTLAELPVNGVIYQPNTVDKIFIATDAGGYFKETTTSTWKKYGHIPNVRVPELRYNNCTGELVAATFGRGIWKTQLTNEGSSYFYSYEIATDEVWSTDRIIDGNIIVNPGVELRIEALIFMPHDSKIIVEPGARLVIDAGVLTNSCNSSWRGVEVWGDKTKPQGDRYANGMEKYQGEVIIRNGGTI